MGACGSGREAVRYQQVGLEHCAAAPLATSLLVTGRRGPFPSYRLNGIYRLSAPPSYADTVIGSGATACTTPASGEVATYVRVDRAEVFIIFAGNSHDANLLWRCEVDGQAIARAYASPVPNAPPRVEVLQPDGTFVADGDVVMVAYPAPPLAASALRPARYCWKGSRREPWEFRLVDELPPPSAVLAGAPDLGSSGPFVLWGEPGTADCLLDLVQGGVGNCGVLAAVDALAFRGPQEYLGGALCLRDGSDDGDGVSACCAKLFDPLTGAPLEWDVGALTGASTDVDGSARVLLEVAAGLAVPRFGRSFSARLWGLLIEAALADLAGGHSLLGEHEPGVVWHALLGPRAEIRRHGKFPGTQWLTGMPDTRPPFWRPPACIRAACRVETAATQRSRAALDSGNWWIARRWRDPKIPAMGDEEFEMLLEDGLAEGKLMCVYPVGDLRPSKELGEPCVPVDVAFGQAPPCGQSAESSDTETIRFPVGHAYSLREVKRAPPLRVVGGASEVLWLRLRDPRRIRLFWVQWPDLLKAGNNKCMVLPGIAAMRPRHVLWLGEKEEARLASRPPNSWKHIVI